ncbi:PREDICTED: sp110 nuclear body protein [Chinchilla lanigera]|uniref:sp110 nuclear body protein n=1 Tax=Chinchilla lanigera TaxID=34839 RepID=UPI00038EEBD6|nr:PREDICTED: sp110 nuclear body protein [Chinchilla lanigera]XP_005395477.1 PREDICTED: sp110 nuclear body protein [Chinchilla lanigera]XP_013375435.1 PREDICTED: sp110 nuclear body protein [Chinchilla lanigera]
MFAVSRALEKALLQHFMQQKLEIAYAINKPFPFFELLRDKSFISESTYTESLEACRNLVPVCRVVYNILTKLEKTFNLSLLVTLFGQINLYEYPSLKKILRSFINVGTSYGERSRTAAIPLKFPADPEEGSSLQTLLQLLPPQPPPARHLSCAPTVSEARASLQQTSEGLDKPPSPSAPAVALLGLILGEGSTPVASDNLTSKRKKEEDSQEMPSLPSGTRQALEDASAESSDPEEPQEAPSTSAKKKGKKRKVCIWSSPKRRHKKKCLPEENPTENTVDFFSPTLPVTCGEVKGILYKKKMEQGGASEKSIQNEKGTWVSPKEFTVEGKRERSKNWRRSVRCGGQTLAQLIENGILLCPPATALTRKALRR